MDYEEGLKILNEKRNVNYDNVKNILKIVKEFIIKRDLVLYGGQAIDYALRIKGDKLYGDINPDYDFYSPNLITDAYDLAEEIAKDYDDVTAFNAIHITTIRVSYKNVVVADVSYMPNNIIKSIPILKYPEGDNYIKIVHPKYQKGDMYKSFTSPFRNAPREVIFHRFEKDIKRLAMLDKYYPDIGEKLPDIEFKIPKLEHHIVTGLIAYNYYIKIFSSFNDKLNLDIDFNYSKTSKPTYIVENEINEAITYKSPYMDGLIPKSIETEKSIYHITTGVSYYPIKLLPFGWCLDNPIRLASIHGVLMNLLVNSYSDPKYWDYYVCLKNITLVMQDMDIKSNPFHISIDMYGSAVTNEYLVEKAKHFKLDHLELRMKPKNYKLNFIKMENELPIKISKDREEYDINKSILFKIDHSELKNFDEYKPLNDLV